MVRVMFVCHGNICRSPMAECIMRKLVQDEGMGASILVDSAGTSDVEAGNPVYPPAAAELKKHGVGCAGKRARRLKREDFSAYDYFICMDKENLRETHALFGTAEKQYLLLAFTGWEDEVADPWYTRDFARAYRDIEAGCTALFWYLRDKL